jgi:DNA-binding winged helix-turn-helix (wHTH) protein
MRLRFGACAFDSESRLLTQGGRPVQLEPKAFALLELLLERRPAAVSKASIRDRLWATTYVSESSLTTLVAQLRRALGTDARLIRTVRAFGYAVDLEPSVSRPRAGSRLSGGQGSASEGPWVTWQEQVVSLVQGENVLGRDPEARVVVDMAGVSRRHARIVLNGLEATIEDLSSKNGTFVEEHRIDAPTRLVDRDRFRLGRTVLVYRCPRLPASTVTEASERGDD